MKIEVEQTVWSIKPFKEFTGIDILQNEKGFRYHVQVEYSYGPVCYMIFKNCIIGGIEYLCNQKVYELRETKYFDTYDECLEELKIVSKQIIIDLLEQTGKDYPLKKHTIFAYKEQNYEKIHNN